MVLLEDVANFGYLGHIIGGDILPYKLFGHLGLIFLNFSCENMKIVHLEALGPNRSRRSWNHVKQGISHLRYI